MNNETWANIPEELRWQEQWLLAGPNEKGELKVPITIRNDRPAPGSSTDSSTWMDFELACEWAKYLGYGIGYVLSADDPYAVIDLDVKNQNNEPDAAQWTTQEQLDRFWAIVQRFDSYTERSRSMQGLHIWVRANIGKGCKYDGVEVYSQERFIVCTGSIVVNNDINHMQDLLDNMVGQIRALQGANKGGAINLVELDEVEDDATIVERAMAAANGDKYNELCAMQAGPEGGWVGSYKSQSEADLALMSIYTFYSKSNEQCRRLFRMSNLAKREKSMKDNRYLDLTLQLIRGRQAREAAIDEHGEAMAKSLVQEMQTKALQAQQAAQPGAQTHALPNAPATPDDGIPWPPGLAGRIAWHIYSNAPRPVKEVAIVATLGLLAGICGKAYQIPQSGLNLYVVLVAKSATGKEAMHSGIGNILAELRESCPPVHRFVDFADFASGQALQKACASNSSFVNVSGEWGKNLEALASGDGRNAAMHSLRKVMTNLYQKSGTSSVVAGISYSDKEQNVASVNGVAYSMIGESTPGTFYEALTEGMMQDGFLSRFTVIEYNGKRPPLNPNPPQRMEPGLAEALQQLCVQALTLIDRTNTCNVQFQQDAYHTLCQFDTFCDEQINATQDEKWRQMWNRAHLKVLRISALLAVGDNHLMPVVYPQHVAWAVDVVQRDINMFRRRIMEGDIGSGDAVRDDKVLAVIREYLEQPLSDGYRIPPAMQQQGIIPKKYLTQRCSRITAFAQHRLGATLALDNTIRSLVDNGYLMEMDKGKVTQMYGFHGKCYRVVSMPATL